ncbi:MAG: hypothetical protein KF768_12130 [Phycisphaeraceae bacterium]|nr:hypothetical protein [Phycisphaeraceae bacterium]
MKSDDRPAPGFAVAAERYNARLEHIQRLRARVVVRLRYRDDDGKWQDEQAEGTLQLVLPDRVALSLGKAGRTVFWFGCDAERYWWFDVQDRPTASVGVRTPDGARARAQLGVNVAPWDLVRLLGVMRIDAAGGGVTEWSTDRSLVGVTTAIRAGGGNGGGGAGVVGYQRIWADPKEWFPVRIELWDANRRRVVVAELEGDERAEIMDRPVLGHRPRMPARVSVLPEGSEAQIRLSLSDVSDQRVSDRAFELDALLKNFSVEPADVRDLDAADGERTVGAER